MHRLLNVSLRGLTLVSKFLLIFFLAKFLSPADVGTYGLLTAAIGYGLYVLGLEFYTFANRELIKTNAANWGAILKSQLYLTGLIYILISPILYLIFVFKLIPQDYFTWFILLLPLEHLAQELNRVFIAMSRPILASTILFLRSAFWILLIVPLMAFNIAPSSLMSVLIFWSAGVSCAIAIAFAALLSVPGIKWNTKVNWGWVIQGLKVALPFLVSALALRGIFTLDRYWMEYLTDLPTLGSYVLYLSISNALISFLDSGVFVFNYPKLISAHQQNNTQQFKATMVSLYLQIGIASAAFIAIISLTIYPVLAVINRPEYYQHLWMLPTLLIGAVFWATGTIAQYALYAQSKDKVIVQGNVLCLFVFAAVTYLMSLNLPHKAIPIGLLLALIFNCVWFTYTMFQFSPAAYMPSFTKPSDRHPQ